MDLEQDNCKWMILGMLRSPEVMEEAFHKLELRDFRESENPLRVAFLIGKSWFQKSKSEVPYDVVVSEFESTILKNRLIGEADAMQFAEILQWCYGMTSEVKEVKTYILEHLRRFIVERKIRPMAEKVVRSEDVIESVSQLNKEIAKASISGVQSQDPFAAEVPMLSGEQRVPWGVDFIDIVTSGGALPGETTLLLAPSGGGKTLTNIQLATAASLAGEDTIIISYEQAVFPGLTNRIYSYAMGVPLNTFNGLDEGKFKNNRALSTKFADVKQKLKGKMHLFDMLEAARSNKGGSGGPSEVGTMIKQVLDKGANVRYVGIDWLGPMVNNYMAMKNISQSEVTKVMNNFADELRLIGRHYNVNIFIYHQLGTQASQAGARRKPEATDAFQCRTLHHYMDTVICIGNRDHESNLAWITAPKVRNGQPYMDMTIQMEGAFSRWKMVDKSAVNTESMKVYGDVADSGEDAAQFFERKLRTSRPAEFSAAVRENLG
jgi:hypothetical protein